MYKFTISRGPGKPNLVVYRANMDPTDVHEFIAHMAQYPWVEEIKIEAWRP